MQAINKMLNLTKDKIRPTQLAIFDPFKNTTDDLEELDSQYDDGFTTQPHNVSVTTQWFLGRRITSPYRNPCCYLLQHFAAPCSILQYFTARSRQFMRYNTLLFQLMYLG
jgi:hypothetical protein